MYTDMPCSVPVMVVMPVMPVLATSPPIANLGSVLCVRLCEHWFCVKFNTMVSHTELSITPTLLDSQLATETTSTEVALSILTALAPAVSTNVFGTIICGLGTCFRRFWFGSANVAQTVDTPAIAAITFDTIFAACAAIATERAGT